MGASAWPWWAHPAWHLAVTLGVIDTLAAPPNTTHRQQTTFAKSATGRGLRGPRPVCGPPTNAIVIDIG